MTWYYLVAVSELTATGGDLPVRPHPDRDFIIAHSQDSTELWRQEEEVVWPAREDGFDLYVLPTDRVPNEMITQYEVWYRACTERMIAE